MPFKSKAQMRYFFWAEKKGKLPKGTAEKWAEETKDVKSLPERKRPRRDGSGKGKRKGLGQNKGPCSKGGPGYNKGGGRGKGEGRADNRGKEQTTLLY